jgi:hypothetical protein
MKEVVGDIWSYDKRKGFIILITTNGYIKNDGTGVMGAGTAKQAADRYPELPRLLGEALQSRGNVVTRLLSHIGTFPVKNEWMEDADLKLIRKSAKRLKQIAEKQPNIKFVVPKPGCGNGNLEWEQVKPIMEKLPDNVFVIDKER